VDFCGLALEASLILSTSASDTRGRPVLLILHRTSLFELTVLKVNVLPRWWCFIKTWPEILLYRCDGICLF
jgi:hypothetical protein